MPHSAADVDSARRLTKVIAMCAECLVQQVGILRTCVSLRQKGLRPLSDHALAYEKAMAELREATRELEEFYRANFKDPQEDAPSQAGSGA